MTARSGEMTGGAAVVITKLVMESARTGAEHVRSGGKRTKTTGWWE